MKHLILIAAVICLVFGTAAAQTNIGGKVVEAGTGTPVSGALVKIDGTAKQAYTTSTGSFSLFYDPQFEDQVIQAEAMNLSGYIPDKDSRLTGQSIMVNPDGNGSGTASATFNGGNGTYTVILTVIPEHDGNPSVKMFVGSRQVISETYPSGSFDLSTRTPLTAAGVYLQSGDVIKLEGTADNLAYARVDKITLSMTSASIDNGQLTVDKSGQLNLSNADFFNLKGNRINKPVADGMYIASTGHGYIKVMKAGNLFNAYKNSYPGIREKTSAATVNLTVSKNGYMQKQVTGVAVGTSNLTVQLEKITSDGWPDANTTGIRGAGLTYADLQPSAGMTITVDGAVIDKRDISGSIRIKARNVTIKRCRVRSSGSNVIINESTGLKLEYCELAGTAPGVSNCIAYANYTARYCDLSGADDGAKIQGNVTIEHSYIHDCRKYDGTHNDALQATKGSNVIIRHNRILGPYRSSTSAIKLTAETGNISNYTIEDNFLSGGGYTIYVTRKSPYPCPSGVKIINNVFEKDSYQYNYLTAGGCSITFTGNMWNDGTPVR